jgi:putative transposase
MTQKDIVSEPLFSSQFNFSDSQKEALVKLKVGHSFTGKDGILTPFIKQIINATLDYELEQHLEECRE